MAASNVIAEARERRERRTQDAARAVPGAGTVAWRSFAGRLEGRVLIPALSRLEKLIREGGYCLEAADWQRTSRETTIRGRLFLAPQPTIACETALLAVRAYTSMGDVILVLELDGDRREWKAQQAKLHASDAECDALVAKLFDILVDLVVAHIDAVQAD